MEFRLMRLISLLALAVGLAFGQGESGMVHIDTNASSFLTSIGSGNIALAVCNTSSCGGALGWSSAGGWIPAETRKADTPGPTLAQVKAARWLVPAKMIASPSYLKVANAIGLKSAAIEESNLLQALKDREVKVYDFDKVDQYLYRKALKQGANMRWVWKPMRSADMKAIENSATRYQDIAGMGFVHPVEYTHPIPERVIDLAGCLLQEVENAIFFVSDYSAIHPDPFMAVTTPKLLEAHKVYIVAVWDEPTFNDGGEPLMVTPMRQIASR